MAQRRAKDMKCQCLELPMPIIFIQLGIHLDSFILFFCSLQGCHASRDFGEQPASQWESETMLSLYL